jgi:N-formylglutamate deformylase
MVVSDMAGRTSDPFLLRWVVQHLRSLGYRVQANHPYQGAELVRRHGRPAQGRHSLQIEINRALYMDEARFERHDGFERLARDLGTLVAALDDGLRLTLYPPKETAK